MNLLPAFKLFTIYIFSIFYISVGIAHFWMTEKFMIIIPDIFPFPLFLVLLSGFFEITLGVLLLIKKYRSYACFGLVILLIAVFPANIYLYIDEGARNLYGNISQLDALVRMFFQFPLIILAYWHGRILSPKWFDYFCCYLSIPTIFYFSWILV
tara:strand:- start:5665 stop:6126 length:462 start_codon:yes stop_codon:yes gene_type:complete